MNISPTFSEIAILKTKSPIRKLPTSILNRTSDVITIKVSGNLQRPKYIPVTDPKKVLKKTTEAIWEGIEDIFSGIF